MEVQLSMSELMNNDKAGKKEVKKQKMERYFTSILKIFHFLLH